MREAAWGTALSAAGALGVPGPVEVGTQHHPPPSPGSRGPFKDLTVHLITLGLSPTQQLNNSALRWSATAARLDIRNWGLHL